MNPQDIKLKKEALELSIKAKQYIARKDVLAFLEKSKKEFKEKAIFISQQSGYPLDFINMICDDIFEEIYSYYEAKSN